LRGAIRTRRLIIHELIVADFVSVNYARCLAIYDLNRFGYFLSEIQGSISYVSSNPYQFSYGLRSWIKYPKIGLRHLYRVPASPLAKPPLFEAMFIVNNFFLQKYASPISNRSLSALVRKDATIIRRRLCINPV